MRSLHLLKSSNGIRYLLTPVFVLLFLTSLGMISHNAFAMGSAPSTCNNLYNGTITSFIINNGSQTFDAVANPGVVFNMNTGSNYNTTFVIHTASESTFNNTNSGYTWYDTNSPSFWWGACVGSTGPNQNATVFEEWVDPRAKYQEFTQGVSFQSYNGNTVSYTVNWIPSSSSGASTVPSAPQNLQTTSGNAQVSLSWSVPSSNGGSPITNYNVYRGTSSGTETLLSNIGNTTSYNDTAVTNGQQYFYKITSVNSIGESPQSNEVNATPKTKTTIIEFSSNTSFTGTVNASTTVIIDKGVTVTSNGITNYGNITNEGIIQNNGSSSTINNHGTILNTNSGQISNGILNNYQSASITNYNTGQYQQGEFFLTGINNYGNITSYGGLQEYYATITNYGSGVIKSYNDNILYGASVNNYGRIDSFGVVSLYFGDIFTNGTFNNHSSIAIQGDQDSEGITNGVGGIFNNFAGGQITIPSRTGGYVKHFYNSGIVNNNGSFYDANLISNSGVFNNNGTIVDQSGSIPFPTGTFSNYGAFYNLPSGTISNSGIFNNECGATYTNHGNFTGNLIVYNCRPVPQNLQASSGISYILLSWTAPKSNSTYQVTNYEIYRTTHPSSETYLTTIGNVTSYNDTTLTNGQTYYYKISAANSTGQSPFSNEVSGTPSSPATIPNAPTGLAATAISSSQINLSWTAPANNGGSTITGYVIERSTDNGTTWSTIQSNTSSVSTTYSDTGLTSSTAYTYRVSAINSVGTSSPSNTASATTSSGTITSSIILNNMQTTSATVSSSPYQTTIVNFNAGTGTNHLLVVGVEANNNNVASITFGGIPLTKKISTFSNNDAEFWYLKNPSGTGNIVVTMAGSTSVVVGAYSFSGVDQTTPIPTSATNHNTSPSSPTVSITTQNPNSWVLDSPSIYGGTTLGSPTCTQQWDANIASAITGASSSSVKSSAGSATCTWTASGSGELWDDAAIEVKASGTGVGTATSTAPGSPTGLTATATSSSQINLSWTAPSSNGGSAITGYKIERSTDGGTTWSAISSNVGSTTYSDTGLAASTSYTYRVSAINSVGTSSPSNVTSATTSSNMSTGIVLSNTQSTSGTASDTITISGFNTGSNNNRLLVVGVEANNNNVASITFGGVALQNIASSFYNNDAEFWYLKNPSGTGDVIVTMNGQTQAVVGAYAFSGVNQTVPIPTHVTNHNTNANSPKISLTTKYANDWALDLPSIYGGSRLSTPTCTQQWDANVPSAITGASSSTMVSSPGAVACGWTASSADFWDDVAVEINAAR